MVKGSNLLFRVIPAKAGIQEDLLLLDPGFRRSDGLGFFNELLFIILHR